MTVWIYVDTSKQVGDVDHLTPAELTGLARAYRNITVPDRAIAAPNIAATRGAPPAGILPSR